VKTNMIATQVQVIGHLMVTLFRNIRQIRQPLNLEHIFCTVFVHIPRVNYETKCIRM